MSSSGRKNSRNRKLLDLERYVPALVTVLANRLTNSGSAIYRRLLSLGATEMRVMVILAVKPNISGIRIGTITGLDKAAVSRALKSLQSMKLITVNADPSHGRRQSVVLTASGRRVHDKGVAISLSREQLLLNSFTPQEREVLIEMLNRMVANLPAVDALTEKMSPPDARPELRLLSTRSLIAERLSPARDSGGTGSGN